MKIGKIYKEVNNGLSMHIDFESGLTQEQRATILNMIKIEQRAVNDSMALNNPKYPEIKRVVNLMKEDILRSYKEGKYRE